MEDLLRWPAALGTGPKVSSTVAEAPFAFNRMAHHPLVAVYPRRGGGLCPDLRACCSRPSRASSSLLYWLEGDHPGNSPPGPAAPPSSTGRTSQQGDMVQRAPRARVAPRA